MTSPRAVVTDIEGTTSSISFVKDVLFPYARAQLPLYVSTHAGEPEVRRWLDQAAMELSTRTSDDALVEVLQHWMDEDRKHTALKALQGLIWKDGYQTGAYRAHVYPDVAPALAAWKAAGHGLYVYSSGSVLAQQLFFAHSEAGDLSELFSGYFDTEIGAKRDAASFARIAAALERPPGELLFLSDVVEELDAAREAGLGTILVDRSSDYPMPRLGPDEHDHPRVESFADVRP